MKRWITAAASALTLALTVQTMPPAAAATAATTITPRAEAVADAEPPNRGAEQFDIWSKLSVTEWDEVLEESCIEDGGVACKMTAKQVAAIPDDIKALTEQLGDEMRANSAEQAELEADRAAPQSRAFGSMAAKITRTITKFTNNKVVKKLADNADEIGEVAGDVTNATYIHNGLNSDNAVDMAKTAVYLMPVIGDVFSLGEAIANQDVEGGLVAVVSLIGTAMGAAFPPAGAAVAVGLAVYYVAKLLFGWLCSKPRDWIADPPGDPQELAESGAYFDFEVYRIRGRNVPILLHDTGRTDRGYPKSAYASETLLMDSKWTQHNKSRNPVTYQVPAKMGALGMHATFASEVSNVTAWQDGKKYTWSCFQFEGSGIANCGPSAPFTISLGHPAVVKVTYKYSLTPDSPRYCIGKPPCVPQAEGANTDSVRLNVLSEGKKEVELYFRFTYGIVA